jgi:hypothetical protein
MRRTTGVEVVLAANAVLSDEEQEEAFEHLAKARLARRAEDEGETARRLRSLRLVASRLGSPLTIESYRSEWRRLKESGKEISSPNSLIDHFGSWRQAREALELAESSSARQIEARFAKRRLDKIWRYTEETLSSTIAACVRALGHVPQVAEFEHWRRRELEIARAKGDDALHLPSAGPYRRRYGSWEKALLALGYTPDQVVERLDRSKGAQATGAGLKQA